MRRTDFDITETRLLPAAAQAGDERAFCLLGLIAHGVLVLELDGGLIAGFDAFIDPKLVEVLERAGAV